MEPLVIVVPDDDDNSSADNNHRFKDTAGFHFLAYAWLSINQ